MSQAECTCLSFKSAYSEKYKRLTRVGAILLSVTLGILNFSSEVCAQPPATASLMSLSKGLEEGVYLYGQTRQRDQMGMAYLVFEVTGQKTIGAFYMPSSSFDCFYGEIEPDRLDLSIVNSYEQSVHNFEIALAVNQPLVAGSAVGPLDLEGFYPLNDAIEASDKSILSTCQANYGDRI